MYCCTAFRLSNEWPCSTWAQQHCLEPTQVQSRKLTAVSYSKAVASYLCILQLCRFVVSFFCVSVLHFAPLLPHSLLRPLRCQQDYGNDAKWRYACHIMSHPHLPKLEWEQRIQCLNPTATKSKNPYIIWACDGRQHGLYATVWHRDCIERFHKELWKCKGKVRQTFQLVSADVFVSRKSLAAINHPIWMHSRTTCYTQKSESELLGNSMLNSAFRRH